MGKTGTLLITRPLPAAKKTAERAEQLGFQPFILPLSNIKPLDPVFDDTFFDAVLATSTSVFDIANPEKTAPLRHLPLYCVGVRTAGRAEICGFDNIVAVAQDVKDLAQTVATAPLRRLLYLAGCVRRSYLEEVLAKADKKLKVIEVYDTVPLVPAPEDVRKLPHTIDAVLLYSAQSARALLALTTYFTSKTQFFCLSERIAAELPKVYRKQTVIAETPDENALFFQLEKMIMPSDNQENVTKKVSYWAE